MLAAAQVPVGNQVRVRVLNGVADGEHPIHPVTQRACAPAAPFVQGFARDVLEREIRRPVPGDAAIEQAGNARVIKACQDFAPGLEQRPKHGVARIGREHVQHDPRMRVAARGHGLEAGPPRVAGDFADQPIRGELAARFRLWRPTMPRGRRRGCGRRPAWRRRAGPRIGQSGRPLRLPRLGRGGAGWCPCGGGLIDKPGVVLVRVQQREHLRPHSLVGGRGADPGLSLVGRKPARGLEQFVDLAPGCTIHDGLWSSRSPHWILPRPGRFALEPSPARARRRTVSTNVGCSASSPSARGMMSACPNTR